MSAAISSPPTVVATPASPSAGAAGVLTSGDAETNKPHYPTSARTILVNGRFVAHRITGVQRYAHELTRALGSRARLVTPSKQLTGIRGHAWEQFALLGDSHTLLWSPCGSGPLLRSNQIVTIHDLSFIEHPEWFGKGYARYYQWTTPILCKRARHIAAVSEFTRERVITLLGVNPKKVSVIYNGVDPRFCLLDEKSIVEAKGQFNGGRNYILFVGSVEPRKNLKRLIEAWSSICHQHADTDLLVAGGSAKIYADSISQSVLSQVRFLGYVEDQLLPSLYAGATAFVYPSLYEGFGLPVIEAMSCGTPVITSLTTSLPEVAGDAAVLVDPVDVHAIANSIRTVLNDLPLRLSMRDKGLKRASQFTWDRSAREMHALCERIEVDD